MEDKTSGVPRKTDGDCNEPSDIPPRGGLLRPTKARPKLGNTPGKRIKITSTITAQTKGIAHRGSINPRRALRFESSGFIIYSPVGVPPTHSPVLNQALWKIVLPFRD
jgi:hypothetical protein